MPPRYTYWTIILEGKPTAFRASKQEELLPTFKQLQARHPDTVMMWFARGRLWKSEDEAREALRARRPKERRGPDWRPGGTHEDPRKRFEIPRDEKRRRFRDRLYRDRSEQQQRDNPPSGDRGPRPARSDRPAGRPMRPGEQRWRGPARKPDGPGRKPDGPGHKPGGFGRKPDGPGRKPGGFGRKPDGPGRKPGGFGRKPGGPGRKPGGGGGRGGPAR